MIDTFTSALDYPIFIDDIQPDDPKRQDRDELKEWINGYIQDRI